LFTRVRDGASAGYDRLRNSVWLVVQAAVAASLAYFLAEVLVGHEQPFFAPLDWTTPPMSALMHSAVSFGTPDMLPPDVGSSIGPISLHNAITFSVELAVFDVFALLNLRPLF
jgi:hypothetical protein